MNHELETLLSHGEFLRLKPCKHAFKWVPLLSSQKGAAGILEKSGTSFEISGLYQEQYERELDEFCQAQKQIQAERQKTFKASLLGAVKKETFRSGESETRTSKLKRIRTC